MPKHPLGSRAPYSGGWGTGTPKSCELKPWKLMLQKGELLQSQLCLAKLHFSRGPGFSPQNSTDFLPFSRSRTMALGNWLILRAVRQQITPREETSSPALEPEAGSRHFNPSLMSSLEVEGSDCPAPMSPKVTANRKRRGHHSPKMMARVKQWLKPGLWAQIWDWGFTSFWC